MKTIYELSSSVKIQNANGTAELKCKTHNGMHAEIFDSKSNLTFVWANISETCGA